MSGNENATQQHQQQDNSPPAELLRAILTRLAGRFSDAELARMMDTNPRYIARWRAASTFQDTLSGRFISAWESPLTMG